MRILASIVGAVWLAVAPAAALETDQYLAWGVELRDSRDELNAFVNREVVSALEQIDRGRLGDAECRELPPRVLASVFRTMYRPSRLRRFLKHGESVERYPRDQVGYWGYLGSSLFRAPAFPFVLPMARTIRVDGVNIGTDKIGHLFGFGRRYYKRYMTALERGAGERETLERVVLWGLRIEKYVSGGILDGVFSYADLEANYQGLRLALDLCGGESPLLKRDDGGWRLTRPIDLADYVTPNLDESFNNSHFSDQRWRSIRKILERYCTLYDSPAVKAQRARYRRTGPPSPAMEIIADHFDELGVDRQRRHSIEAVCGGSAMRMAR